jgi:hypothetical protein
VGSLDTRRCASGAGIVVLVGVVISVVGVVVAIVVVVVVLGSLSSS